MARRYETITELYHETIAGLAAPQVWQSFLTTACHNFRLPFDEQVLLFAQRPDATAVLPIDGKNGWNQRFGRWVNRGATGIAVFDGDAVGRSRLKYYFDISDTHESRFARPVPIWTMRPEYEPAVTEALENSFGELEDKFDLAAALLSAAKNAVEDNMPDYLTELKYYKENSFLEELDDLNIEVEYRRALENSIGFMLLARCVIDPAEYFLQTMISGMLWILIHRTPSMPLAQPPGILDRCAFQWFPARLSPYKARLKEEIAHLRKNRQSSILKLNRIPQRPKGAKPMSELTYTMQGGYRLPNLLPPQEPEMHLGKYALLRRTYLKQHRRVTYTNLLTSGKLNQHLMEIEQTAKTRIEQIMAQMAKAEGVTEELKASDPMKWTGLMNNLRHSAEETVLAELIYN